MSSGADFTDKNLTGAEMKAAGLTFACRYLSGHSGGWKELSLAEAKDKTAHGILIVSNWEDTGRPANTVAQGESDAKRALAEAHACGMPLNRPIYFSIDHDVAVDGADNYFKGINNVFGGPGNVGVYASAGVIQHLHGKGLVKWGWRTMSTGWHGGASTVDSQIEQTGGSTVKGTSIDKDKGLTADIGGWLVGHDYTVPVTPPVKPPVTPPAAPKYSHELINSVHPKFDQEAKDWQAQMNKAHGTKLTVDGLYGNLSKAACKNFQRVNKLVVDGVVGPKTWAATFK